MTGTERVETALGELRRGRMVLVLDDEDRENEGDLVMAAEHVTAADAAFLIRHTSGVLCVAMSDERADELDLPLMVADGDDPRGTAFTVTVDLKAGTTTGVSAADRAATITALADPATRPQDLSRPGHVFPLRARRGGVLARPGHTEATVDLCRLAGVTPVGVLGELTEDDGTMTSGHRLHEFAAEHHLVVLTVGEIAGYVRAREAIVVAGASAHLPTRYGEFRMRAFRDRFTGHEHLALVHGAVRGADDVLTRVHSECLTGDVLGSSRCDCGQQLDDALSRIVAEGRGVLAYLRGHEGRGIGLGPKVRAYELQDAGLDTVDANLAQGLPVDARDFTAAAEMLHALGVRSVRLLSNNDDKLCGIAERGVVVSERVPLPVTPNPHNLRYITTKSTRLGHDLPSPPDVQVG